MVSRRSLVFRLDARAFTVVELLLVLLMTAVIVTVSISAYRTSSVRAEISTAIVATAGLRTAVAELYLRERRTPASESEPALGAALSSATSALVDHVRIADGRIDLTYGPGATAIAGRVLSLTPYETADLEIVWICGNRIPGPGLEPLGFSGGGPRAVQAATTVETRFLPSECR